MNKELQKLLKQINDKKNEVKSLVNDGKLDKAKAAKEELKELQNRFDLLCCSCLVEFSIVHKALDFIFLVVNLL